jgi:hypothetical protein
MTETLLYGLSWRGQRPRLLIDPIVTASAAVSGLSGT